MVTKLEAMLIAEKRGFLPDDQKEILKIARERGIVPKKTTLSQAIKGAASEALKKATLAEPIYKYGLKAEMAAQKFREGVKETAAGAIERVLPTKDTKPAKTPIEAATGQLRALGETVAGHHEAVSRTGQQIAKSAAELIIPTPMEIGTSLGVMPVASYLGKKAILKFTNSKIAQKIIKKTIKRAGGENARIVNYGTGKLYAEFEEPMTKSTITRAVSELDNVAKVKYAINQKRKLFKATSKAVDEPKKKALTSAEKVVKALRNAKSIIGKQETLYARERAKRIAEAVKVGKTTKGEVGFRKKLSKLKGELPRAQFESIRKELSQADIYDLFTQINDSPLISEFDKISAGRSLAQILGEFGGSIPGEAGIAKLHKVFGKKMTQALLDARPMMVKLKSLGLDVANIPRSLMSSYDLSGPFRQGAFFISRPKQFVSAFKDMVKSFAREKNFKALHESIAKKPSYQLMLDSKLALSDMDSVISLREEAFKSALAEKIPVIGGGVRASGRAYTGFLNKLRADVFEDMVNKAKRAGYDAFKDRDLAKGIADFVNNGTGKGSLGQFEQSASLINGLLFSPKLMMSRLNLMNPMYYMKMHPFVRREALKSLFANVGLVGTVISLSALAGGKVEINPTSSDFGKVRIGNTRIDVLAGFGQYAVLAARLLTGQLKSTTTGKTYKLGEGYKPITRLGLLSRSLGYKQAPVVSFVTDYLRGKDIMGNELNLPKDVAKRMIPMVAQDMYEIYQDDPTLLPLSALGVFGFGLQTYGRKRKNRRSR